VTTQISAIELNPELVNVAYEMGLNVQKTCENALKEAIRRLQGLNPENLPVRNAGTASFMLLRIPFSNHN
jgi:exonuclease VII small subunit